MTISVSSQTSLLTPANFFVFALYDATAPTVLLESQAPAKAYGNPLQISFTYNCLNGHIYIIKLWESANSTPTGVVRNSFSQSVNQNVNSVSVKMDEYLEADVTAGLVSGATAYVNLAWNTWDYSIERIGLGTMVPNSSADTNPNYSQDVAGGFHLIQSGDTFQPNEKFVVRFVAQASPIIAVGGPSAIFSTGAVITADTVFTNSDVGKALLIQSAISKITLTLPLLSTVVDFSFMYFYSAGGYHTNALFLTSGTDKIIYYGGDKSRIILGQEEVLILYKAFGKWNVENDLFGVKQVGELLYSHSLTEINTHSFDGSLLSRTEYSRLWDFVSQLGAGIVVTDSVWTSTFITVNSINYYTKKGCFSTGDGSTTFRIPLINNYFLRPVDGSARIAGSFELQDIQAHVHPVKPPDSGDQNGYGKTTTGNQAPEATGIAQYNTISTGGTETKPSNIGIYMLIRT